MTLHETSRSHGRGITGRSRCGRLLRPLLFAGLLAVLLLAGRLGWTSDAQAQTVPPTPAEATRLIGPIDAISDTHWVVAGVVVTITADTRIDDRVDMPQPGRWARVEGQGDGAGALVAFRIKVLPPLPTVRLKGPLDELTDTRVVVDGIVLARTVTTRVLGNPVPGRDRVAIRAAIQSDGSLLALKVVPRGVDDGIPEEEPPDFVPGKVELKGVVQALPDSPDRQGTWLVSGITVTVDANTVIQERVGPLALGAWVQVEGMSDGNGGIRARTVRTRHMEAYHKLEGVLDSLDATQIVVSGIAIQRTAATVVQGNPQPGQPVEVKAMLDANGKMVAVRVKAEDPDDVGQAPVGHEVKFKGVIQTLPDTGLYGVWVISGYSVNVVPGLTEIDEHKGVIRVGVRVKVEAVREADGTLTALEIEVEEAEDDHGDDEDHDKPQGYIKFKGVIESLPPGNTLIGTWMVSGKQVIVTPRTELEDEEGPFQVGARVKIKGYRLENGAIRAREIETEKPEDDDDDDDEEHGGSSTPTPTATPHATGTPAPTHTPAPTGTPHATETPSPTATPHATGTPTPTGTATPGPEVKFEGRIVSFPQGLVGTWQIGARTVIATQDTEFDQDEGPFAVGVKVKVKGWLQADGTILARRIQTDD